MIKPPSTHDFDGVIESRSRNLVHTHNLGKAEKMLSPEGLRVNNGMISPTVNQSMSLDKFPRNSRFTSFQNGSSQQQQQNFFVSPSSLKQVGSGPDLHKYENHLRPKPQYSNF